METISLKCSFWTLMFWDKVCSRIFQAQICTENDQIHICWQIEYDYRNDPKSLDSLGKQCKPRSNYFYRSSLIRVHTVSFKEKSDDSLRCWPFFWTLSYHKNVKKIGHPKNLRYSYNMDFPYMYIYLEMRLKDADNGKQCKHWSIWSASKLIAQTCLSENLGSLQYMWLYHLLQILG